jgi:hypothetical protein
VTLAAAVTFDEERHEYWYKGGRLSGVTGLIAAKLGIRMPAEFVEEHREEGAHIHKAVQKWIEKGDAESIHPGVGWIIGSIGGELGAGPYYSEVLVSDFKQYASAVDIVVTTLPPLRRHITICDIKKGVFHREYVSWQLGIYKYFIEIATDYIVDQCVCICVRDREYYKIFPKSSDKVRKLLYG